MSSSPRFFCESRGFKPDQLNIPSAAWRCIQTTEGALSAAKVSEVALKILGESGEGRVQELAQNCSEWIRTVTSFPRFALSLNALKKSISTPMSWRQRTFSVVLVGSAVFSSTYGVGVSICRLASKNSIILKPFKPFLTILSFSANWLRFFDLIEDYGLLVAEINKNLDDSEYKAALHEAKIKKILALARNILLLIVSVIGICAMIPGLIAMPSIVLLTLAAVLAVLGLTSKIYEETMAFKLTLNKSQADIPILVS